MNHLWFWLSCCQVCSIGVAGNREVDRMESTVMGDAVTVSGALPAGMIIVALFYAARRRTPWALSGLYIHVPFESSSDVEFCRYSGSGIF
jgi:hypothetical protein